jgi:hypothetical protein
MSDDRAKEGNKMERIVRKIGKQERKKENGK